MAAYPTYQVEVSHQALHKYRLIRGTDPYVVEQKAAAQRRVWDEMWRKKQTAQAVRQKREDAAREKESKKALAAERTAEAQAALESIEQTLLHTLDVNDRIEWDSLVDRSPFPTPFPPKPQWHVYPKEPQETDPEFTPTHRWYHGLLRNLRRKAEQEAKTKFLAAHEDWVKQTAQVHDWNKALQQRYDQAVAEWQTQKQQFEREQALNNERIAAKKKSYFDRDPQAIAEYCDMVLSNSQYPDTFPQEWNLDYQPEAKTLAIDYFLPSLEDVPSLKEVRYIASRDEFTELHLQESALNKMYDSLLYQIALRTIHALYEADQIDSLASVVLNGWVRSIDKGTGKPITVCVLSVQAAREEFEKMDLKHVEPKTCFKTLKGVGSSKLHGLSPIAPILQLNKEDKRFVSSYSVVGDVDQSTNLACMDWVDFEHLIREVFEKEFSEDGGEVKITQASRDGGVDAVAFDPDPIRGGKIIIQAKRYTNIVGVSAVRDLYGTVVNEGATKGILVTTADYGPDAYGFAKGKPLTLLNGSNLLHLLEKHGHRAVIDLKAAKQMLAEQKKAEQG